MLHILLTVGRVSFYAFLEDTIFQTAAGENLTEADNNAIPNDSQVQSTVVLSATIVGSAATNLKSNVTITFELNQVGLHKFCIRLILN